MIFDWNGIKGQRFLVLVTAFSFILLTVAIVTVYNAPMTGYEYSVYQSTPFVFWIAIIVGLINGILLFVMNYGKNKAMWGIGLFEILLSNFVLISLYLYRGFIYIERSDSQSYVGYAKDIVQLGNIPSTNFYPMMSILMASTGDVIGQSMVLMSQIFPAIFFTAYTIGILCWSRTISTQARFITSMMLASMPIFFAWFVPSIFHETFCVLMLPLSFFILWRSGPGSSMFKTLLVLIMVLFVAGHPLVAIFFLLILTIKFGTEFITKKERTFSSSLILCGLVIFLGWIAVNALLVKSLQDVGEQLLGMVQGVSTFGSAQGQASQLGILSALQSILVCTIDDIIYALMALWVGTIIVRSRWRVHPMTQVMACFLGGSVLLAGLVLFTFTHNPFRMINLDLVMIFTIPLVGYQLYTLRCNGKVGLYRLVTVLILFCLVSTVFTVYQDPIEVFANGSVTKSEIIGSNWFISNRGDEINIYNLQTNPWRYADLIYGAFYGRENPDIVYNMKETTAHFDSFYTANYSMSIDYLVLTKYDVAVYTQTWKAINKFNVGDFTALSLSTQADHIYTNSCLTVYLKT